MLTLIKLESTDSLSGAHTGKILRNLTLWIGLHLTGAQLESLNFVIRKGGHMLGYGTLCLCWLLLFRGTYWMQHDYIRTLRDRLQTMRFWWRSEWAGLAVLLTFVVAAADELHQMSIPSRSGSWHDVALDTSAGGISACLVFAKAKWRCREVDVT